MVTILSRGRWDNVVLRTDTSTLAIISHINFFVQRNLINVSPGQNGRHFADDIFRHIFMNEKFCIMIKDKISKGPINNNPSLV